MSVNETSDSSLTAEMKRTTKDVLNKRYIDQTISSFLSRQASLIQETKVFTTLQKMLQYILQEDNERYVHQSSRKKSGLSSTTSLWEITFSFPSAYFNSCQYRTSTKALSFY